MSNNEILSEMTEIVSWIDRYVTSRLAFKRETTKTAYALILRQFLIWLANLPGHEPPFDPPTDLTQTAVQTSWSPLSGYLPRRYPESV